MKLQIDKKVFEQNPDLKIGAVLIKEMNNERRVSAVEGLLRGMCAQKHKEFKGKDILTEKMIGDWYNAFGKLGINPKKKMISPVKLLKLIKTGKDVPHETLITDLHNYFSLKYMLPVRGEDMDWLFGDLQLNFAKGGEPFRAKNSIDIKKVKEGEIGYFDKGGVTCRYWNVENCERTKITPKTTNTILLIEDLSRMHMDAFGEILQDIQKTILRYVGGMIEAYVLNEENYYVDLGVQGRSHADDSKVPQQEKAYFMSKNSQKQI